MRRGFRPRSAPSLPHHELLFLIGERRAREQPPANNPPPKKMALPVILNPFTSHCLPLLGVPKKLPSSPPLPHLASLAIDLHIPAPTPVQKRLFDAQENRPLNEES